MINNVVLVGKVIGDIKKIKFNNKQYAYMFLFINKDETKIIKVMLKEPLINDAIDNICECQHIGLKGHIDIINNKQEIIVDTLTIAIKKEVE